MPQCAAPPEPESDGAVPPSQYFSVSCPQKYVRRVPATDAVLTPSMAAFTVDVDAYLGSALLLAEADVHRPGMEVTIR